MPLAQLQAPHRFQRLCAGILTEYHDVSDPFTRAWILNRLILLIPNSDPNTVRSGLSRDPEFGVNATSSLDQITANIAAYSYGIYPTSQAAYFATEADIGEIIDSHIEKGSIAQKHPGADADIFSWIAKGDQARTIEMQYASSTPYGAASYIAWTNVYRSYPLAALALDNRIYWPEASTTFDAIYTAVTTLKE